MAKGKKKSGGVRAKQKELLYESQLLLHQRGKGGLDLEGYYEEEVIPPALETWDLYCTPPTLTPTKVVSNQFYKQRQGTNPLQRSPSPLLHHEGATPREGKHGEAWNAKILHPINNRVGSQSDPTPPTVYILKDSPFLSSHQKTFSKSPDPELPGHLLLEQYQDNSNKQDGVNVEHHLKPAHSKSAHGKQPENNVHGGQIRVVHGEQIRAVQGEQIINYMHGEQPQGVHDEQCINPIQAEVVHVVDGDNYDPMQALAGKWEVVKKKNDHKSTGAANTFKEPGAVGVIRNDNQLLQIPTTSKRSGMRVGKDFPHDVITRSGAQRINNQPDVQIVSAFVAPSYVVSLRVALGVQVIFGYPL
ncbi:hypothetical protein DKX38_017555 [Salix brachista]|uniref:Uncharacterized protein n=1 Tax=Salix brachista TaxID=2182728 RepID=A0A5N5KVL6_9ROSI|nr:hypothetical protein DKX38_017555 [Salix brachista]